MPLRMLHLSRRIPSPWQIFPRKFPKTKLSRNAVIWRIGGRTSANSPRPTVKKQSVIIDRLTYLQTWPSKNRDCSMQWLRKSYKSCGPNTTHSSIGTMITSRLSCWMDLVRLLKTALPVVTAARGRPNSQDQSHRGPISFKENLRSRSL